MFIITKYKDKQVFGLKKEIVGHNSTFFFNAVIVEYEVVFWLADYVAVLEKHVQICL